MHNYFVGLIKYKNDLENLFVRSRKKSVMFTFPPLQLLNPGTHDFSTHIQENRNVSKNMYVHAIHAYLSSYSFVVESFV